MMTATARDQLRYQLIDHYDMRLTLDLNKAGCPMIGCGRNLISVGLSEAEAKYLLDGDITRHVNALVNAFPEWFPDLDEVRQRALVDLCFDPGIGPLKTFTTVISCFARKDYPAAANALIASKWFWQVGRRGPRIATMIRTGTDPGLELA